MDDVITEVRVQITAVEHVHFPVWLRFALVDADGVPHEFVEKAPVIMEGPVPERFPHWIYLPVKLVSRGDDRVVVNVDKPLGLVSTDGETRFEVAIDALLTVE